MSLMLFSRPGFFYAVGRPRRYT